MTFPPMDPAGPAGPELWMNIADVFHITGRGTVVTGVLQGNVQLNVGDTMLCDGQTWTVGAIEMFRAMVTTAEPGMNVGILLKNGPKSDVLRGQTAQFKTRGNPQFNPADNPQFTVLEPKKKRWRR
jgi:translation elongation factor EF-Tu-like GTPase